MVYSECKSCWLITHGYEANYRVDRVAKCGLCDLGRALVEICPCFQCLTKTLCRKHCEERLNFWNTRCFVKK